MWTVFAGFGLFLGVFCLSGVGFLLVIFWLYT